MRLGIALASVPAFVLVAAAAHADTDGGGPVEAWTDFTRQDGALENLSTSDCETACKALESLARAAAHICSVAPEHCEEARSRLAAASDRVHAACPQCVVRTETEQTRAPVAKDEGATAEATTPVAQTAPEHGGCAGCAAAPRDETGRDALCAIGSLLLLAGVRRRRRR